MELNGHINTRLKVLPKIKSWRQASELIRLSLLANHDLRLFNC